MYLPIMLNSIVHVLVYLNYVLTALGKQSWSWWSRYLTQLQLAQFVVRLFRLRPRESPLSPCTLLCFSYIGAPGRAR